MSDEKNSVSDRAESHDMIYVLDIILAIARHKRLIAGITLCCLALSLAYSTMGRKQYEASSMLISPPPSNSSDTSQLLPFTKSVERIVASLPSCSGNRCQFDITPDSKTGQTVLHFRASTPELAMQGANESANAILTDNLQQGTTPAALQQKLVTTLMERTRRQIVELTPTLPRKTTLDAAILQWPNAWRLAEIRADLSLLMFYKTLSLTDISNYSISLEKFITQQALYSDSKPIAGSTQEWLELNALERKLQVVRANLQDITRNELVVVPALLPTQAVEQPRRLNALTGTLAGLALSIVLAILLEGWKRVMQNESNRRKIDQIKAALRR
jgi:hypothetical protein